MRIFAVGERRGGLGHIDDWVSLGAFLGVKTQLMAYALKFRRSLQKRIRIGDRTVYRSSPALKLVQSRLTRVIERLFDRVSGNGLVISYRKGLSPVDAMRDLPHAKVMMSFDIRHYYDNIRIPHIEKALYECGMTCRGATLVGRYCVVERRVGGVFVHSLQQGCPASPAMSNLVGKFFLDDPLMRVLGRMFGDVRWHYRRYCDNILVVFEDDVATERLHGFERAAQAALKGEGFRTHKWEIVRDNHPAKHQKFLGMVLNDVPRIDTCEVDRLRAILFNWMHHGTEMMVERMLRSEGAPGRVVRSRVDVTEQVIAHLRGRVGYVEHVNEKQGLMLRKMFRAAKLLSDKRICSTFSDRLFEASKSYRNHEEGVDAYLERVREAMPEI